MIQGARHEHAESLNNAALELGLEIEIILLRSENDVLNSKLDAIVLPGGESTTMRKVSETTGLLPSIFDYLEKNPSIPVLATCAGAILLIDPGFGRKPFLDAEVNRNSYGRQKDSFQANLNIIDLLIPPPLHESNSKDLIIERNHKPLLVNNDENPEKSTLFPGIFIRAPRFKKISATVEKVVFHEEEVVGMLQNSKLLLSFHPELTNNYLFHRWLLNQVKI